MSQSKKHDRRHSRSQSMVMEMDPMTLFQTLYSGFGEHLTEHDVMNGFDEMDTKGNSKITFKEFEIFAKDQHLDRTYSRAKDVFDLLSDGENSITLITFKRYVDNPSPGEEALEFVTKLLGGWAYDPDCTPAGAREMSMSRIKDLISDKQLKTDWKDRIRALQSFTRQVCRYSKVKFEKIMRKYAMFYTFQLKDRRTKVHRCVCMSIAKIAMSQNVHMLKIVPRLLSALFEFGIRSKIQIVADNAAQAALALIRHVPDTNKGVILKVLLKSCQDKGHDATRMGAFGLLSLSLAADYVFKIERNMQDWKNIADVVESGIRDKDEDVRHNAFSCLAQLEGTKYNFAKPILEKMSKVQSDSYEKVKQFVDLTNPALYITESIQAGALLEEDEESAQDLDPLPAVSPIILSPQISYSQSIIKSQRLPLAQAKRRYTMDEDMWEVNEYDELLDDIIGLIETDGSKFTTKEEMGRFFPGLDISVLPENLLVDSEALRTLFPNLSRARDAYQEAYNHHMHIITPRVFGNIGYEENWVNSFSGGGVRPEIMDADLQFSSDRGRSTSEELTLEPIVLSISSPVVQTATQELERLQNHRNSLVQDLFSNIKQDGDDLGALNPSLLKLHKELQDAEAKTKKRGFEVMRMQKELRVMMKDSSASKKKLQIQTPRGAFDLSSQLEIDFYNRLCEQEREQNQYLEQIVAQQNEDQSMSMEVLENKVSKFFQEANKRQSAHFDEVTGLKDQIEELTEQLDEELKSEIKKLQSTINEKALEHTQTVTDLNNLTQKNLQLKITVDSNASKLQKLEVLSSQLKASQNVVVDQDREIKELQSKLESVQKDLHDKTRQFYAMHQKTKGLEKTIHTIHEGKVQKKSDMDVLTRKLDELQNQVQTLQVQEARREAESSTLARFESMETVEHAEQPGYCGLNTDPCCVQ